MKTLRTQLAEIIAKSLIETGFKFNELVAVNYPKISSHGDYTTNVAMLLGKEIKEPPLNIANKLVDELQNQTLIKSTFAKVEAVNPGFINFYLSPEYIASQVSHILSLKGDFGQHQFGQGRKVQIEFISANPTGPLTIGNGRGGFFGDVLGNMFTKCGYEVVKEYLIIDAGKQIEALGHSVLKDEEAVYQGEYIDELNLKFKEVSNVYEVGQLSAKIILDSLIKDVIEEKMKIKFDVWFSEDIELRKTKKVDKIIERLKKENYLYEKDGAWWFKSSDLGDTRDRVLVKGNGEMTYLAQDFAYLENKFGERKFDKVIYVWGADHYGDVVGLLNATKVLGYEGRAEVILLQFVRLIKNNKEVRMSKRAGNYITMSELINLVGHDVARFLFLMYAPSTHMDFDLDIAQEKSEKNPVYYVQYAYARICSLLKQPELSEEKKINLVFEHFSEEELIKELIKWPEILEESVLSYKVQYLPAYAISLADKFHQFYDKCRVITEGEVNWSRVNLVKVAEKVLEEVFSTMGVSAPKKM